MSSGWAYDRYPSHSMMGNLLQLGGNRRLDLAQLRNPGIEVDHMNFSRGPIPSVTLKPDPSEQ